MKLPKIALAVLVLSIDDADAMAFNITSITSLIPTLRLYIEKNNETEAPTAVPSSEPSALPSAAPSLRPSLRPSSTPSLEPSSAPSASPTELRKAECKIRMYYEKKYCWHDDAANHKCNTDYKFCVTRKGEDLEMQDCGRDSKQEWRVIGRTVRPSKDKRMCWTRNGDRGIKIKECGGKDWKDQQFEGVCYSSKREIRPLGGKKWCLTSGHEPRKNEKCKFQECSKADNSNTHRWVKG
mmetsp:Transcript_5321/g.11636  ORF Transcript_5321/g.11636 Transcript_5321/m.11636 type:complete len:238 (+) Transcript_5321:267-980(+)